MTITNVTRSVSFTGNGSATTWAYGFIIPDAASARVKLVEISTGIETILTSSLYTITGLGNSTGGSVTYPLVGSPLAATHHLVIYREVEPKQTVNVTNQTTYYADVVMTVWDRIVMMVQELTDGLQLSLRVPVGETSIPTLPAVGGRASKYLAFDSNGDPIARDTVLVDDTAPKLGGALDAQGFDLNNVGVAFLLEQAAANADVAGSGQLWVKTATPNQLWFTDDAGTDFQLGTGVSDADKGDITVSGGGLIWTIDPGVVTLGKMANMATNSLLGRTTALAGAPEVLSKAAVQTMLNVVIGTDVQAFDAALASISLLGSAADKLLYTTALNTFAETPFTLFARTLMDDADAATMRATLGVDAAGTDNSTNVSLAGTGTYLSLAGQAITVDPITESDIADLGTLTTMNTDIGVTVQAHSAVLDATTASFLTAHKAKLDFTTVTQAVNLDTMESRIAALSAAVVLKGTWSAALGTFPVSTVAGESWIVSVAGTAGGIAFVANDRIIATVNAASTTIYAANWHKLDYTDAVLSVAGRTGAVALTVADLVGFTDNSTNWNTAFTWGNHATAGYLTGLALSGLSDTTITTIAAGELLKWSGTAWINNTLVEAGVQASNARLSDIAGITYAGGDLLYHNGTNLVKLPKGTAAQVLTMDGAGAVPTWAAATGGGGGGGYTTNISLLYLYTAENKGNRLNMVGGIMDPFADQTDVDTVASTNEVFSAGHYTPYVTPAVDQIPVMLAATTAGVTISASSFYGGGVPWHAADSDPNNTYWLAQPVGSGWLEVDFGAANNKIISSYTLMGNPANLAHGPKNFTLQGSNDNITWVTLDTQVNQTSWVTSVRRSYSVATPASYRYYRLNVSASNSGTYTAVADFELIPTATTNPMLLVPNAFTASAVPTTARIGVQASGTFTINTDLTAEVSRDGGTTWAMATLVLVDTLVDGTSYYEDAAVSVAAQPAGTAMKYRIKTYNATSPTVSGVLLQWS